MLGSTHGTLTTDFRARVVACGEEPHAAVHSMTVAAATEGVLDVSGRPLYAAVPDLDRFFRPGSVAVIGASDAEGRPNTGITRQLIRWAERVGARLYPVHPTRESVFGLACSPSVAELPEQVDLAVLLVGDPLPVIEELAQAKVRFAVAFASGFAETGEEGAAAQARLAAAVERSGLRLLGPNTNLNAFEKFRDDLDGPAIALITQSGHQGRPVYTLQELGVRLSHWAPTGNEADLETADFISYFSQRPEVGAIACYVEGLKDGRSFLLAADRAARAGVPVVAVKVGRTETGARMAASHTGKLTGADQVVDAAMRQFGVIRVDGLDELQDTAALLARARKPQAEGVVVYSISGGTGAHFSDLATGAGLDLPTLSEAKQRELHEWIPDYLNVANPVDNGGHPVGDWRGRKIIDAILADPDVGVLICPITGPFPPMSDKLAQDLVDAAESTDKLVCVVWGSPVGTEEAYRTTLLGSSRVATFRTFGNCITAVKAYLDHHRFAASYRSPFDEAPRTPSPSFRKAQALMRPGRQLSEHAAKQLLVGVRDPGAARAVGDQRRGVRPGGGPGRLPGRHEGLGRPARPQDRTGPGQGRPHLREPGAGRVSRADRHRAVRGHRAGRDPGLPDGRAGRRDDGRRHPGRALRADGDGRARGRTRRGAARRGGAGAAVRRGPGALDAGRTARPGPAGGRARRSAGGCGRARRGRAAGAADGAGAG